MLLIITVFVIILITTVIISIISEFIPIIIITGRAAWGVASTASCLWALAVACLPVDQPGEAGLCRVPQPQHGQQVCCGWG